MPATNIYKTAKSYGLQVIERDIGIFAGMQYKKYIGVSKFLCDRKKREVIAHEIAHLQDDTVGNFHILAEKRADKIGRNILLPESVVLAVIDDHGECNICTLSQIFGVSYDMMEKRIRELF